MNAQQFADSLTHPVVFMAGVGIPAGEHVALLGETLLPFELSDVEGPVSDGILTADNLTSGPGRDDWKFSDWNSNTLYKIQVFNDPDVWHSQNDEYNEQ